MFFLAPMSLEPPVQPPPAETPAPRGGRRRVVLTAVVFLAIGAVAGAFVGARHEAGHWKPLYSTASQQAASWKKTTAVWKADSGKAHIHVDSLTNKLQALRDRVSTSVGNLDQPHFMLWNTCKSTIAAGCPLTPGQHYVGGVPDTFTYHVKFHATVPVTVRIMSSADYVCWQTGQCSAHWVSWDDKTKLNAVFHEAEGCADYLAVYVSDEPGTLYPEVSVTRNSAHHATGVCK